MAAVAIVVLLEWPVQSFGCQIAGGRHWPGKARRRLQISKVVAKAAAEDEGRSSSRHLRLVEVLLELRVVAELVEVLQLLVPTDLVATGREDLRRTIHSP